MSVKQNHESHEFQSQKNYIDSFLKAHSNYEDQELANELIRCQFEIRPDPHLHVDIHQRQVWLASTVRHISPLAKKAKKKLKERELLDTLTDNLYQPQFAVLLVGTYEEYKTALTANYRDIVAPPVHGSIDEVIESCWKLKGLHDNGVETCRKWSDKGRMKLATEMAWKRVSEHRQILAISPKIHWQFIGKKDPTRLKLQRAMDYVIEQGRDDLIGFISALCYCYIYGRMVLAVVYGLTCIASVGSLGAALFTHAVDGKPYLPSGIAILDLIMNSFIMAVPIVTLLALLGSIVGVILWFIGIIVLTGWKYLVVSSFVNDIFVEINETANDSVDNQASNMSRESIT